MRSLRSYPDRCEPCVLAYLGHTEPYSYADLSKTSNEATSSLILCRRSIDFAHTQRSCEQRLPSAHIQSTTIVPTTLNRRAISPMLEKRAPLKRSKVLLETTFIARTTKSHVNHKQTPPSPPSLSQRNSPSTATTTTQSDLGYATSVKIYPLPTCSSVRKA